MDDGARKVHVWFYSEVHVSLPIRFCEIRARGHGQRSLETGITRHLREKFARRFAELFQFYFLELWLIITAMSL